MNRSASGPESESFNTYFEYNRVLRTWFVAFGIGGPALFLVNDALAQRLVAVGRLRLVVVLFLIGVAAQVVGAFINKVANWYVFQANLADDDEETWIHAAAERIVRMFWIDVILDLSTIGVFGWAAWILFTVFAVEG
jgi:hypothetical protein